MEVPEVTGTPAVVPDANDEGGTWLLLGGGAIVTRLKTSKTQLGGFHRPEAGLNLTDQSSHSVELRDNLSAEMDVELLLQ